MIDKVTTYLLHPDIERTKKTKLVCCFIGGKLVYTSKDGEIMALDINPQMDGCLESRQKTDEYKKINLQSIRVVTKQPQAEKK